MAVREVKEVLYLQAADGAALQICIKFAEVDKPQLWAHLMLSCT